VLISPEIKIVTPRNIHVFPLCNCCARKQLIRILKMCVYEKCIVQCYAAHCVIMVLVLWF